MCSENNDKCCLYDILNGILMLQENNCDTNCPNGCDKPFLGPTPECICYNTRPVSFYNCQTGELWNIDLWFFNKETIANVEKYCDDIAYRASEVQKERII